MIDILIEMIKHFKDYSDTNKSEDVEAFIEWLCYKNKLQKHNKNISNNAIVFELNKIHTEIKNISKGILKRSNLSSLDDYYYLQELKKQKLCSKSVLINSFNHEVSKGNEIIKRLLNANLLMQTVDKNDKRVKLIKLTPQALTVLGIVENQLTSLYDERFANYYDEEKESLLRLLKK